MSHGGRWSSVICVGDHYEMDGKVIDTADFLGLGSVPETKEQCEDRRKKNAEKYRVNPQSKPGK
jgi:hypothetical protein